jgi:hypothetical protein
LIELRVEHLTGPHAGKARTFGVDVQRVTVGTDPDSDIVYAPRTPGVLPEQAELVRGAGRYELHVNESSPTLRNGRAALQGECVDDGDELRFGGPEGPSLRIHYVVAPAWSRRPKYLAAVVAVAIVVLAAAGSWLKARYEDREFRRAAAQLLLTHPKAPPTDWRAVLNRVRPSVYAVDEKGAAGSETLLATAWVIAPGRLATNGHVAKAIDEARANDSAIRFVVRSPVPPYREFEIVDTLVHPGYASFQQIWQEYGPQLVSPYGEYHAFESAGAYDVAILTVKSDASLEPPLRIADDATLYALQPGEPIAFVGYPAEGLLDVDPSRPNPRIQRGTIVSLTSFTRTVDTTEEAQLVEHSLPGTGGASGSPIVNARGEVIAILNGGNVLRDSDGKRMANPAQVNFAQRIDVVRPLIDPSVPFDVATARDHWLADISRYPSSNDVAQARLTAAVAEWRAGRPGDAAVMETDRALDLALARGVRASSLTVPLRPGEYLASALGKPCKRLDLDIAEQNPKGGSQKLGEDAHTLCYAAVSFALKANRSVNILLSAITVEDAPVSAHVIVYRREDGAAGRSTQ